MPMPQSSRRILLLDDEDFIRIMARDMLSALGYECDLAQEGGEAVSLYRKAIEYGRPYCAVIVDLTICEGMGGLEAARIIREMDSGARLVVSSGFSEQPVMEYYRDYGFVASLPKPYRLLELKDVLDSTCGGGH